MEQILVMQQQERDKREIEIQNIIFEILSTFSSVAVDALGQIDIGSSNQPELLHSLWEIIHCNEYIQLRSGIPLNYITTLSTATNDMKQFVMESISNRMITEMKCLYEYESWELIRQGPYTKLYIYMRF